jgi:hypothetical protein
MNKSVQTSTLRPDCGQRGSVRGLRPAVPLPVESSDNATPAGLPTCCGSQSRAPERESATRSNLTQNQPRWNVREIPFDTCGFASTIDLKPEPDFL